MDKPTLQDVKEYFKNAKEVKGNIGIYNGNIESIDDKLIYYYSDSDSDANGYYIDCDNGDFILYDEQTNTYAEIISYKEPLYQLTAKEIVYGHDKPQYWKDTFKECFETELEVGGWYKDSRFNSKSFLYIEDILNRENGIKSYGFGMSGNWSESCLRSSRVLSNYFIPSTEKEVEEALVKEAIKRGYEVGNYKLISGCYGIETNKEYVFIKNTLYFNGDVIFHNGQWAETIPTYTIPEAESKFNIKIKAV